MEIFFLNYELLSSHETNVLEIDKSEVYPPTLKPRSERIEKLVKMYKSFLLIPCPVE